MRSVLSFLGMFGLLALSACGSIYDDGRSSSDVPAHISVINVKDIYLGGGRSNDGTKDPAYDVNPSQNDQEVLSVSKANILSQFSNLGYKVIQEQSLRTSADISARFYIAYMPERWPLVDRSITIYCHVYDHMGLPLFKISDSKSNSLGLIGALAGSSRDDMIAGASRNAVVKCVDEMRKGTKADVHNAPLRTSSINSGYE